MAKYRERRIVGNQSSAQETVGRRRKCPPKSHEARLERESIFLATRCDRSTQKAPASNIQLIRHGMARHGMADQGSFTSCPGQSLGAFSIHAQENPFEPFRVMPRTKDTAEKLFLVLLFRILSLDIN